MVFSSVQDQDSPTTCEPQDTHRGTTGKSSAAIIVAKLLYVARHAWPTTTMVAKLSKLIKNYVWHGYFGELDGRFTTWLNERVAGLA